MTRVRIPYSQYSDEKKQQMALNTANWREKKRIAKRAILDAERAARTPIPEWEIAWAAGHFEGEGTCTVTRSGGHHTSSFVDLTSTDREVVEFFQARWSATSVRVVPATDRHKAKYVWRLSGERMRNFLLDIQPYLVTARRKALFTLALEIYDARRRGSRDPQYAAMMDGYRQRVAELNRRGPANVVLPGGLTVYERVAAPIALEYETNAPSGVAGLLGGPTA